MIIPSNFKYNFVNSCTDDVHKETRIAVGFLGILSLLPKPIKRHVKVPRTSILEGTKDQDILDIFSRTVEFLRSCGAEIIDHVKFPTWTRAENQGTLSFVWGQLKKSACARLFSKLYSHLPTSLPCRHQRMLSIPPRESPYISTPDDLIDYTKEYPLKKISQVGSLHLRKSRSHKSHG